MPPPKNITDLVAKNEYYGRLQKEQQKALRTSIIAKWSERDLQREHRTTNRAAVTLRGSTSDRDAGIKCGLETVKAARQARLKELFEREALMYEKELNAMGLSLAKPRD
ncbi:hypothetical protein HYH03_010912 [Edaphochlamys debaryana]|uniref:Uncharacterized protein n=1 Tax=Edaphochlamys debaryana TaxID=47281 RepID=A0A835Y4A5_9CHLO|nr:hypothetical protein HYH03_010912 [Edaphochlamys debaryana]|eukprot:KAG2490759.1 hypothetical protein HYH03_010912 [Edaphochlamys debaryana]